MDPRVFGEALGRLCAEPDSDLDLAVIVRQPQLTPAEKLGCWRRFRGALGLLGVGVDLVVAGAAGGGDIVQGLEWVG